jgi:hypothetical protein
MTDTIILRHDGVDRTYHCANALDAMVLFDALSRTYQRVEWWKGAMLHLNYRS